MSQAAWLQSAMLTLCDAAFSTAFPGGPGFTGTPEQAPSQEATRGRDHHDGVLGGREQTSSGVVPGVRPGRTSLGLSFPVFKNGWGGEQ